MKLRHWEIFRAVSACGSVTEAAQMLGLSQPAVSHALRHAEDRIGIPLFTRSRGKLVPTAEASQLFPHVEHIFDKVAEVEEMARRLRNTQSGRVSVATIPTLAVSVLPRVIAEFRRLRKDVTVRLDVVSSRDATSLVASGAADLGVVHLAPIDPALAEEALLTSRLVCVMPAQHRLARRDSITLEQLDRYPLISGRLQLGAAIEAAFAKTGRVRSTTIEVNHSLAACALAAAGAGIAVVDPLCDHTVFSNLIARPLMPPIPITTHLIYVRRTPMLRLTQLFAEAVRSRFREIGRNGTAGNGRPQTT